MTEATRRSVNRSPDKEGRLSADWLRLGLTLSLTLGACEPNIAEWVFTEPNTLRSYRLILSSNHQTNEPTSVLFVLHPFQTEPNILVDSFALKRRIADKRGWILVVPEGRRNREGHRFWNASRACCARDVAEPPDDLNYLKSVLRDVKRRYLTDDNRVFALGESNGAFMAYRWACDRGGDLSAVVCIAGVGPGPYDPPCTPGRRVNVLHIHGDDDEIVYYRGKAKGKDAYPSAQKTVGNWARLNGIQGNPTIESTRWLFLGRFRRETWKDARSRVQLWTIKGARHHIRGLRHTAPQFLSFFDREYE